jgi:dynein heavy chain
MRNRQFLDFVVKVFVYLILFSIMSIENLLPVFQEMFATLENVANGLESYLETKRRAFPRFYFLSSDELLDILSQTKDVLFFI